MIEQINVDLEMKRDLLRGYSVVERVVDARTDFERYVRALPAALGSRRRRT